MRADSAVSETSKLTHITVLSIEMRAPHWGCWVRVGDPVTSDSYFSYPKIGNDNQILL